MKPQLWIEQRPERADHDDEDGSRAVSRYSPGMRALDQERARRSIHDRWVAPVIGRKLAWHKPADGGLWTSTFGEADGWIDFMDAEQHYFGQDRDQWRWWMLLPRRQARIYTVDDLDDLIQLVKTYPGKTPSQEDRKPQLAKALDLLGRYPDWEAVSKDYDAVHLTSCGQAATRRPEPGLPNLSGWDCESTLWFRWVFSAIIQTSRDSVYHALGREPFTSPHEDW